ncbi:MAG: glycosyltransferase [Candidatus Thorarchaeota archaeon]
MISTLPPEKTGESIYTANLIDALLRNQEMEIIAIAGPDADVLSSKGGRVETKRIWNGQDRLYPLKLFRAITKMKPHIVHVQFGPHGQVYGGLFGEPMLILLILLKLAGIRTTITSHSTWMPSQVQERVQTYSMLRHISFLAKSFFMLYMKLLDWGTSTIQLSTVTLNSQLQKEFLKEYDIRPSKVYEIPHPCKYVTDKMPKEQALFTLKLDGKKVILLFGFIRRGKGFEVAIKSMKEVINEIPEAILVIAGSPIDHDGMMYLDELVKLKKSLTLDASVLFHSRFISESEISVYFSAASIILFPYDDSVGASGPAHNQAGYGIPIIASDVGFHMREMLGGNVALFEKGNPMALSQAIVKVLSNPEFAQHVGNSIQRYSEIEDIELLAKRTLLYYRNTLERV